MTDKMLCEHGERQADCAECSRLKEENKTTAPDVSDLPYNRVRSRFDDIDDNW